MFAIKKLSRVSPFEHIIQLEEDGGSSPRRSAKRTLAVCGQYSIGKDKG